MLSNSCVKVDHVYKKFGNQVVLQDITLEVPKSQIFGLLGPSGSGKTTLVKLISGIDVATSGDIRLLDVSMPKLEMMNQIGYMSQSDALYMELSAQENLEFFAALFGLNAAARKIRIQEVMELVDLQAFLKKSVASYSGGMKRRLSLAIALLHKPKVLILDEPTVGIDPVLRKSIWDEFTRLSQQGTTIIVTTHVMDEADKCHRLGMIREGKLIAVGSPAELKQQTGTNTIEEAFLYYEGVKS
ncbi:ABC transporter ATP-binding protein [Paenibacillus psychroresistens]|uniref:ABC transporter ATP-binding protein n=1 Tax=Paenibacillus psychroresistens TaxID=1778678 RepID=A0A6B8RN81_9BACL|nr:ABC transporter ATP-binding protein [Paenibacillus psychroresistens]QGQ96993.1 ABC transporter ATP-binding protein [Paenibacillus psychroresistens]